MTNRQYLVTLAWLQQQWNRPTRSDSYLMQIACEVRRVLSKDPRKIHLSHFELEFGPKSQPRDVRQMTAAEASLEAQARWKTAMGTAVEKLTIKTISQEEARQRSDKLRQEYEEFQAKWTKRK